MIELRSKNLQHGSRPLTGHRCVQGGGSTIRPEEGWGAGGVNDLHASGGLQGHPNTRRGWRPRALQNDNASIIMKKPIVVHHHRRLGRTLGMHDDLLARHFFLRVTNRCYRFTTPLPPHCNPLLPSDGGWQNSNGVLGALKHDDHEKGRGMGDWPPTPPPLPLPLP